MLKLAAMAKSKEYLVDHEIGFVDNIENAVFVIRGLEKCPDKAVEGQLFYHNSCMEFRLYYTASGASFCRNSGNRDELMSLLNLINAQAFPCVQNEYGEMFYPCSPKIYMTEDFDITFTAVMPYEFYAAAPDRVMEFITVSLPKLMNELSPAIYLLLLGKITPDQAQRLVKSCCES